MSEGRIISDRSGQIARIVFDNPTAHNALTRQMWGELREQCLALAKDRTIRVVTFRGSGGKAFVSGTDIGHFLGFSSGRDGIAYEREIDAAMGAIDALPMTTVAVVEGWAVGGGLNILSACDFRIATRDARIGSPLGRTIGNCLSMSSYARIAGAVGIPAAKRMLLLGEILTAQELLSSGVLYKVVDPAELDAAVTELCERAAANAPLTTRATKEALRRMAGQALPDIDDLIELVYASEDFKRGVRAFLEKKSKKGPPDWTGA
jgi:enoyl-CoA hydratase/carnithine racemase